MTEVHIYRNTEALKLSLTVSGHANTAPKGRDLLCAAVSALAETFIATAEIMAEKGDCRCKADVADGFAEVCCQCETEDAFAVLSVSLGTIKTGFALLESNYPKNIAVFCTV